MNKRQNTNIRYKALILLDFKYHGCRKAVCHRLQRHQEGQIEGKVRMSSYMSSLDLQTGTVWSVSTLKECFLHTASGKMTPVLFWSCWSILLRKALSFVWPCNKSVCWVLCTSWWFDIFFIHKFSTLKWKKKPSGLTSGGSIASRSSSRSVSNLENNCAWTSLHRFKS